MIRTEEFQVFMGPQHPSTHGVLQLILKLDGERVVEATPQVGFLHRALEKIAENRTYYQYVPYTDRLDYLASMTCNFVYVLAVEKLMDLTIPKRAEYIRVIMAELNRIASHLIWLGFLALEIGATTPFLYTMREREDILDLFDMVCGARITYNYMRIGGVAKDLPKEFFSKTKEFLKKLRERLPEYEGLLTENPIFLARTKNKGIIPKDVAIDYGVSGPNLRGSGIKWDLRVGVPYSSYQDFEFDIPTGTIGDVWDRYYVRVEEIRQSAKIIEQALDKLPSGDFIIKNLPLKLIPPKGEVYARIESPRGDLGIYIVSDGTEKPYRLKIRTPSFSHASIFPYLLKGVYVADIPVICGSTDFVLPEIDR